MTNTIFRVVLIFNFSLSEPRAVPRGAKKSRIAPADPRLFPSERENAEVFE